MNKFAKLIQMDFMQTVKENVDKKYNEIKPSFTNLELSNLIYRGQLNPNNKDLIAAHTQSIKRQLDRLYSEEFFKEDEIFTEFSKSITLFDQFTKTFKIDGGTYGDNFIASQNFYLDAVGSCKSHVPNFYHFQIHITWWTYIVIFYLFLRVAKIHFPRRLTGR